MSTSYELRENVSVIWLDHAPTRNALSRAIVTGIMESVERSRQDKARAIVIAGKGAAFCAGANINDLRDGWMNGEDEATDPVQLFRKLTEEPRVVVAAVHGGALGGGFELTLACDFVVAGPDAFFALPEVGVGVIPNSAAVRLRDMIGSRRALELILTRRRVKRDEAVALGLVNISVDTSDVVEKAVGFLRAIVESAPPGAIAAAKKLHHQSAQVDWNLVLSSLKNVWRSAHVRSAGTISSCLCLGRNGSRI